jgi:hypothetical protein
MATNYFGLLGPLDHRYVEPNRVEAKSEDAWYLFLYGMLRREDTRSRWWVPDPQTLH